MPCSYPSIPQSLLAVTKSTSEMRVDGLRHRGKWFPTARYLCHHHLGDSQCGNYCMPPHGRLAGLQGGVHEECQPSHVLTAL
jgi:hypothetical protein